MNHTTHLSTTHLPHSLPSLHLERRLLRSYLRGMGNPHLQIVLWDQRRIQLHSSEDMPRMTIHTRYGLWRFMLDPAYALQASDRHIQLNDPTRFRQVMAYAASQLPAEAQWAQRLLRIDQHG